MTVEPITSVPATEGQNKHARRLIEDAADGALKELCLDKGAMQRLIEQGSDPIRLQLITLLRGLALTDEFADEEADSGFGYLSGYKKPNPAAQQMADLKREFPQLKSYDESLANGACPPNTEGNFLIPRWRDLAPTYGEALELVLAALKRSRNGRFVNYREKQLGSQRLKESTKKIAMFKKLGDEQKEHDVLVVAAQFGIMRRGKSVRRARVIMGGNECGLGAFETGIMLLTHPNRLQHYDDLWLDCTGDEYAPGTGGVFSSAPYFGFDGEDLRFGAGDVGDPYGRYGSASAFVPVVVPSE